MSDVSFSIDAEYAQTIATAHLDRRKTLLAKKFEELVVNADNNQRKRWFGRIKTMEELRAELEQSEYWTYIRIAGAAEAERMADLAIACRAAILAGTTTVVVSGETAADLSWEIISNDAFGEPDA